MDITKGREYTITSKFSYKGSPAVFNSPPVWSIYNSQDKAIQSGVASPTGSRWGASFTIPTGYIVPGGKEELVLQITGTDSRGASYTSDKSLVLEDADESFLPNGVVYNAVTNTATIDSVFSAEDTIISLNVNVYDPAGNSVIAAPITATNISPNSSSSRGNLFRFTIPPLNITQNTWNDPFQIVIQYTTAAGDEVEIHPLYILDRRMVTIVNRLKMSLDKAQLIEIDEALQWHMPEYIEAVMSGVKRINSSEPENTFWTMKDIPTSIDNYILVASQVAALEMRYMAEGMNAFEFSGLNTSLNYNRADFLSNKIGELNGMLDRLPAVKKSAINVAGKGTPPLGEIDSRIKNIGVIGLTVNTLNNRTVQRPWYRFR